MGAALSLVRRKEVEPTVASQVGTFPEEKVENHKTEEPEPVPVPRDPIPEKPESTEPHKFRIMLCGSGESGKTTFVKQCKLKFIGFITEKEKESNFGTIRSNMIETMQILLGCVKGEIEEDEAVTEINSLDAFGCKYTGNITSYLASLWERDEIQAAFATRDKTAIPDHMDYFFQKIDELDDDDYEVTTEDILKTRVRSIGFDKFTWNIGDVEMTVVDLGGQKNERSKWDIVQNEVDGAIFVASFADFDKPMFEDPTKIRIIDSLETFYDITHRDAFQNKPIFLICNKIDSFTDKIKNSAGDNFTKIFPDYEGDPHSPEECIDYLEQQFMKRAEGSQAQFIKVFRQNSIDIEWTAKNAEEIFRAIREDALGLK